MMSPVFINEAFDSRTFCVVQFLRLFHGPTPLLYVLYLSSSSYFSQEALRCTKESRYLSVKMPGIQKLPSKQKMDAQTYTFIEHSFEPQPSGNSPACSTLYNSAHQFQGCFVQVHAVSPLRERRRLWEGAITIIQQHSMPHSINKILSSQGAELRQAKCPNLP